MAKKIQEQPEKAAGPGRGWHASKDPGGEGHKAAGRKGGAASAAIPGNMAKIGRIGGAKVASDRLHMAEIGRKGGTAVSKNRDRMAEIGKIGGAANRKTPA